MKVYAILSFIILLGFGCRSSSNRLDTSLRTEKNETKKEEETKVERQHSLLVEAKKTDLNMQVDEDITLIVYDPLSGNIQAVQNTKRSTSKNKQSDSSLSKVNNTQSFQDKNTDTHSKTIIETSEHSESKSDSRVVQGWKEWAAIAFIGGVVILVIWLIKRSRT